MLRYTRVGFSKSKENVLKRRKLSEAEDKRYIDVAVLITGKRQCNIYSLQLYSHRIDWHFLSKGEDNSSESCHHVKAVKMRGVALPRSKEGQAPGRRSINNLWIPRILQARSVSAYVSFKRTRLTPDLDQFSRKINQRRSREYFDFLMLSKFELLTNTVIDQFRENNITKNWTWNFFLQKSCPVP